MNYEKRTLTVADKDALFSELFKREKFLDRIDKLMVSLGDYLSDLLKEYVIDKDIVDLFNRAGRIMMDTDTVVVTGYSLGLTDKLNDFPSNIVTLPDYSNNPESRVQVDAIIKFYLTKKIPNVFKNSLTPEDVNKIPKDRLDVFKENFLDILKLKYEKENYLIDYFPDKAQLLNRTGRSYYFGTIHFLHNKTTWSQVKKINEDWFNLLVELRGSDVRSEEKSDKDNKLTPEEELRELKLELNI